MRLAPFTPADETGVIAGGSAAHPLVQDVYFGIRMRVRQQGVPLSETDGGTCVHIAIDDTLYHNITLHTDWDGGLQTPDRLVVCMLDIAELIAHPRSQIANTLTLAVQILRDLAPRLMPLVAKNESDVSPAKLTQSPRKCDSEPGCG